MLICPDCFSDTSLKSRITKIRPKQPNLKCDFHTRKKGVPLNKISPIVGEVIENTYALSEFNYFSGEYGGISLLELVYELTGVHSDEIATALKELLIEEDDYWPPDGGEKFFSDEHGYSSVLRVQEEHSIKWKRFRDGIICNRRFFSEEALNLLKEIFDGIHLLHDSQGQPVIYSLDPSDDSISIFRARVANDLSAQNKIINDAASQLGPPPPEFRQQGRMHPAGIQAFYGAFDVATCIAELRPPVGGTVITARFTPTRPLIVLDTTRFDQEPKETGIFSKTYLKRIRLWSFMREFMHEIAKPHLPDTEYLEYIPTQAVAEYLVNLHKFRYNDNPEMTIDAIVFRSSQNSSGKNIVFFGDASSVVGSKNTENDSYHIHSENSAKPGLQIDHECIETHYINCISYN